MLTWVWPETFERNPCLAAFHNLCDGDLLWLDDVVWTSGMEALEMIHVMVFLAITSQISIAKEKASIAHKW